MSVVAERVTEPHTQAGLRPRRVHDERAGGRVQGAPDAGLRPGSAYPRNVGRERVVASRRRTVAGCSVRPRPRRLPALAALAVAVCCGVVGLGLLAEGVAAPVPVPERTAVVVVEPGQTLWELAERFAPNSESADVVRRIVRLNDLNGSSVGAGTPLVVPNGPDTLP